MDVRQYGCVAKRKTTLSLDSDLLTAVKIEAARTHKPMSDLVEEALRHRYGLTTFLKDHWASHPDALDEMSEDELTAMTVAEVKAARATGHNALAA